MNRTVLDTIGRTPIVRLQRLAPAGIAVYAKLESRNPGGSVKDRLALEIIEDAERSGALRPGQTVIEATSGNTGIGLATVCAAKGYSLVVVMAENFSLERRRLLRFMGAQVVLTPAALKGSGMVAKARELARHLDAFEVRQFENEANARVHERTTAREILDAFAGRGLDVFVTGAGTGGTLRGVAAALRRESPHTRIVVCEPDNAPVLASGHRQPDPDARGQEVSHPDFRPHLMQGWTPDFIPRLTADAFAAGDVDQVVPVAGDDAIRLARDLARKEGILAGISAGATLAGAMTACADAAPGSTVLVMLPDSAERYLSTPLFDGIDDAMNAQEWMLSRATPTARFDGPVAPPVPVPGADAPAPVADPEAEALLASLLDDRDAPVQLFALAWCEYCWAVRRLFERLGIGFNTVELDAPAMQVDDMGNRLRQVLKAHTGRATIPQVFVAGTLIGGCNETIAAYADGTLTRQLSSAGIAICAPADFDPASLLPRWQHPVGEMTHGG